MLKCTSVYTYEIDDPEAALKEINKQLEEGTTLLEHTVGIVMCHSEFIRSGVMGFVCKSLPFNLVGITTSAQAVNNEASELILTIFIITSDDAWFVTGMAENVADGVDAPVRAAFGAVAGKIHEPPKLAIVFPPFVSDNAGDAYIDAFRQVIPETPIYGAIASDDSINYEECRTLYNGECFDAAMPFVLCYGNIAPRFFLGSLPEDRVMPYKSEITKSCGPTVHEINNVNAYEYFEGIGFASGGAFIERYTFVPFAINQKKRDDYDGIPIVRGFGFFTEGGSAVFRGHVDEGSTITILKCEPSDVLSVTRQKIEQVNELKGVNGALLFSCTGRRLMTLDLGSLAELEAARGALNPGTPFMMGYAGGELCPSSIRGSVPTNRFHNYSLVILVL